MKKIYDSSVIGLVPTGKGFVFITPERETEEKTLISYKMYNFSDGSIDIITRSMFLMAKFGPNYEFFLEELSDFINCKVIHFKGNVLVVFSDGLAVMYDKNLEKKWEGSLLLESYPPAEACYCDGYLWCSYPECNTVVKLNPRTMKEILSIGNKYSGTLVSPYGLYSSDDKLFVTSSRKSEILEIDLKTLTILKKTEVDLPILQYNLIENHAVVLTTNGIYIL